MKNWCAEAVKGSENKIKYFMLITKEEMKAVEGDKRGVIQWSLWTEKSGFEGFKLDISQFFFLCFFFIIVVFITFFFPKKNIVCCPATNK